MPCAAESVTGTVDWREPGVLPPGAVLEVTVEDISRADAPATRLAGFTLSPAGPPPLAFSLDVPTPDPRARVAVRASLRHDGSLLYTTDTIVPVLTQGAPSDAALVLVSAAPASAPALTGIDWRPVSLAGAPVPADARDAVLRLDAGADGATFAASVGCNRFAGSARVAGDTLVFGPARSTRMGCPPPLAAAEAALSAALAETARWETDGTTLRLLDAAGRTLLEASAP
jgi:putative lipoprotein